MPKYNYKAVDVYNSVHKGSLEADNELALTTELARKGLTVVSVSLENRGQSKGIFDLSSFTTKKVKMDALLIFTRQFASIIRAAVPIIEGMTVLAQQAEDEVLKTALEQIIKDVEGGVSLSKAMSKHPNVFSDLYVNTVVAGESAGILDKVLTKLAQVLEEDYETKNNIATAMRYPVMVVIAMLVAVVVLSTMVVPQFAKVYSDAKVALPMPTQIMIVVSNVILGPWKASPNIFLKFLWFGFLGVCSCAVGLGVKMLLMTRYGRWFWDGLKFKLPIVGKVYIKIVMLRFVSMLNVLYQAGLPVLNTLDIVGMTIGNVVLLEEVERIKRDVADGKGISAGVLRSPYFPRLVGYMISIGEKAGSLSSMLDSLYEYYYMDVKSTVKNLTSLIEPLMTAVLGVVVMGMAMAIFLPMWSMIQILKGA